MSVLKSAWSKVSANQIKENKDKALKRQKTHSSHLKPWTEVVVKNQVEKERGLKEHVETNLRLLLNNLDLIDTKRLEAIEHVISVELRERDERA